MNKINLNDNKAIIERHPYLKPRNFMGKIIDDADFTMLDVEVPRGWKLLCYMAFEDIREHLIEIDALDQFQVTQLKEKWGAIRCYTNGADKVIYDIIYIYEAISKNVCHHCGKPHTPLSGGYHIWTCCEDCFNKTFMHEHYGVPYNSEFPNLVDEKDTISYRRYSKGEAEDITLSIKETRERYEELWKCYHNQT